VRLFPAAVACPPESYRELLQRIDLEGRDSGALAAELGITRNNLTVRPHRAQKQLRELLG